MSANLVQSAARFGSASRRKGEGLTIRTRPWRLTTVKEEVVVTPEAVAAEAGAVPAEPESSRRVAGDRAEGEAARRRRPRKLRSLRRKEKNSPEVRAAGPSRLEAGRLPPCGLAIARKPNYAACTRIRYRIAETDDDSRCRSGGTAARLSAGLGPAALTSGLFFLLLSFSASRSSSPRQLASASSPAYPS